MIESGRYLNASTMKREKRHSFLQAPLLMMVCFSSLGVEKNKSITENRVVVTAMLECALKGSCPIYKSCFFIMVGFSSVGRLVGDPGGEIAKEKQGFFFLAPQLGRCGMTFTQECKQQRLKLLVLDVVTVHFS